MYFRKPKTDLLASLIKALRTALYTDEKRILQDPYNEEFSVQRRRFLKKTGKAAAAIGLLGAMESCHKTLEKIAPRNTENTSVAAGNSTPGRIVIVGAGIAGLHAAYILKQKGFLAQVYEGSARTGGRMYSAKNILGSGLTTELGGEFIDSIHKDMLQLAKTFNLTLIDTDAPGEAALIKDAYYFNRTHYSVQQVVEEFSFYADKIKRDINSLSPVITADSHNANDVLFDNMSIAAYFDRIGLTGWLRKLLDVAYLTEYGQPVENQSSLNFLFLISPKVSNDNFEIFGASDERYKILGGNQQICDKLAEQLDGQIFTGHELISIRQKNNNTYDVTFQSGKSAKTINCDILLLTIPFTLLRNVEVQPAWPAWKQLAISGLGYGNNSKLMLGFTRRYWRTLGYQGSFFTDSLLQIGWDNSLMQPPLTGGLTIYSGAGQALAVDQGNTQHQANIHLPLIDAMFPGAMSFYNSKAERFVWPRYKWTKASYSCFYPGQFTTIAGNEIKPVDKIFFAGEHCSYNFQGYMNGGAETGRRAAESILQLLHANVQAGVL